MSALGQKRTHAVQQRMSALPPIATAKADISSGSCPLYTQKRTWLLAATAFGGRQPSLSSISSAKEIIRFFRDVGHCRVRPFHVKHSEFTPNTGAIHEKTNLDCDCGNLHCSGCHLQWNEGGYCPTDPTVSSWGFPYHPAPDVGVKALRQNQRGAAC